MPETRLKTLETYGRHLESTAQWILRSIENGRGGSAKCFTPLLGWSSPYPETTGYLIPTLLKLDLWWPGQGYSDVAASLGEWLLEIQNPAGFWSGGIFEPGQASSPSIFNTGQILLGMTALYDHLRKDFWLESAYRGAEWILHESNAEGLWDRRDFKARETPSYYTHVAWPVLEVWKRSGDEALRVGGAKTLEALALRRQENGVISGWSFQEGAPAFTHTVAYTLQGFLEGGRLLGQQERFDPLVSQALDGLARKSELAGGLLPGSFLEDWKSFHREPCLTGNVQTASLILDYESRHPDLRLVSAAARLVDGVCGTQVLDSPVPGINGGVAGSWPIWGAYMRFRYPNWAAKFHCDALMSLIQRVKKELH